MNIGVLGTGVVGAALSGGFAGLGHQVKVGTRDPASAKAKELAAKLGGRIGVVSFADAAAFADVAVLATLWSGTESAIRLAGSKNLAGKVVIDATNPWCSRPARRRRSRSVTPTPAASRCSVGCRARSWSRRSTSSETPTW